MNRRIVAMVVAAVVLVMLYMASGSCGCGKVPEVPEVSEGDIPEHVPVELSQVNELAALPNQGKTRPRCAFRGDCRTFPDQFRFD